MFHQMTTHPARRNRLTLALRVWLSLLCILLTTTAGATQSATVDLAGAGISGVDPIEEPWLAQAKLTHDGQQGRTNNVGWSVALSADGNTALVSRSNTIGPLAIQDSQAYIYAREDGMWTRQAVLQPDEYPKACQQLYGTTGCEMFGWSAALSDSGDIAVIGAPNLYRSSILLVDNPAQPSKAYVFAREGGQWTQQARLMASDAGQHPNDTSNQFGWSVAISGEGDTIVVGALGAEWDGEGYQGGAYVFTWNGVEWLEQTRLMPAQSDEYWPPGPCKNWYGEQADPEWLLCPRFGWSVAIEGDTVLVGAPNTDVEHGHGLGQGVVYAFTREGDAWNPGPRLEVSREECTGLIQPGGCLYGTTLALSGNTALVGSDLAASDGVTDVGAVWVYTREGQAWNEQAKLTMPEPNAWAFFSGSYAGIALQGDLAVVGASGAGHMTDEGDEFSDYRGAVYLYRRDGQNWSEPRRLIAYDAMYYHHFGWSVALSASGDTVLASAPKAHNEGVGWNQDVPGAAYVLTPASAELQFEPLAANFHETTAFGETRTRTALLHNLGEQDLTGLSFSTPGNGFSVDAADCGDTLAAGESCTVQVQFATTNPDPVTVNLQVQSDQGLVADLLLMADGGGPVPDIMFEDRFQQ